MDNEHDVKWLKDRAEVESLAYIYGRAVDSRTREGYALFDQCMTPDVEVVYEFGTWKGVETQKKVTGDNMLRVFTFTHHIITNPLITITGDTAVGEYRCMAAHGMSTPKGQKVVFGGSTYTQDCVRTPAGWRIRRHHCGKSWIDDNGELLALMVGNT
jgi:hypothetical protein